MSEELFEKNFQINFQILLAEVQEYKRKLWKRNRFCNCGAENIYECECDSEKKNRFLKRSKRKINEKFDSRIDDVIKRNIPTIEGD